MMAAVAASTRDEKVEAARRLAEAARQPEPTPTPSLLAMDYRQLLRLGWQGAAVLAVADELSPHWASRPEVPMSTVCKTLPPERLRYLADRLHQVGIDDLDEWCGGDPGQ